jgi:hypothetical protein
VIRLDCSFTSEELELLVVLHAMGDEESLFWSDPDELGL